MQQICALLSENAIAYKLWKKENFSSPGQVVEIKTKELQRFYGELSEKDVLLKDYEVKVAVVHADFMLKSIDVDDNELVHSFNNKSIRWNNEVLKINIFPSLKIKCAYTIDRELLNSMRDESLCFSSTHYIPVMIHGISQQQNEGNNLYCAVFDEWVSLIYLRDEKIKYANSFKTHFPEDMLYYMRLLEEQGLPRLAETTVNFIGRIQRNSELSNLVVPYVKGVNFIGDNENDHLFKDLIWLKECAL